MNQIDLHMHSNNSLDGEFTPKELIFLCKQNGIKIAALTDHNSVRGVQEICLYGQVEGIQIIKGIELDCKFEGTDLHLLGYGCNINDSGFEKLEQELLRQKKETSQERMNILSEMGILFDTAKVMQLARNGIVTGEMIAEIALADERNLSNPLIQPYITGARSDNPYVNFFWDYCSQGKPAYLPINYISLEEAIQLIKETKGKAVIAHPVNTVGRNEKVISKMIELGVEGIEVYSSYHTREDIQYYRDMADRLGIVKTAGSDFHGKTKPAVILGNIQMPDNETKALMYWLKELV